MSRIAVLASTIEKNTQVVDKFIAESGLPAPSFDASNPPALPFPSPVEAAKDAALEAMDELEALLLGPLGKITKDLTYGHTLLTSYHAVAQLNLASSFPADGSTSVAQLAKVAKVDENDCSRLVRHALTQRLFTEPTKGVIKHTAASQAIANVPYLRQFIEQSCNDMWASAPHIVPAMQKWPGSEEPNHTAYSLAKNTDLSFFQHLASDTSGEHAKAFADSMSFFQGAPGMQTSFITDNYNWGDYATIVDVGGSHGDVANGLAEKYPDISSITVQDLPEVIASAPKDTVDSRVTFQPYNFFTEQPAKGADLYLFRMIFHNWSDKFCIHILRNLVPALKDGARIVINDNVVPPPGVLSPFQERPVRAFDLVMKECFNAKERDEGDWRELLEKADKRFHVVEIKVPEGSMLQIIDVQWSG